jgi:hypothetical protein
LIEQSNEYEEDLKEQEKRDNIDDIIAINFESK